MTPSDSCVVRSARPLLQVVVDTEEEFDWSAPFRRDATSVTAMRHLGRIQEVCEAFGVKPCYVADYPVVTQPEGIDALGPLVESGRAELGAHLHPWVNPPLTEEISPRNSYAGNLPPELERAKLRTLRDAIRQHFKRTPNVYKAGRYGIGPNSHGILRELGFEVDCSPCPPMDLREDGGPDYRHAPVQPYRLQRDDGTLLVCPTTGGYAGLLGASGQGLHELSRTDLGKKARLGGIFSRLGLVERIRLSPEGFTLDECRRLTRQLQRQGVSIFTYSLHSPSAVPGHTPYVRTAAELRSFLDSMRGYFEFFFGELGGQPTSPGALLRSTVTLEAANA